MRAIFVAVAAVAATISFQADARDAQELYNKACIACHASGAAGAPIAGNAEAWAPRVAKGMDALLHNVNNGVGAMPPKGMCMDCTDEEFKSLIEFMSAAKK